MAKNEDLRITVHESSRGRSSDREGLIRPIILLPMRIVEREHPLEAILWQFLNAEFLHARQDLLPGRLGIRLCVYDLLEFREPAVTGIAVEAIPR